MFKKMMVIISLIIVSIILYMLFSKNDNEVGDISLGLLTLKDIKIERMVDPKISGVTCFIAHVKGDLNNFFP